MLNISEQLMYLPPRGSIPENIEVISFPYDLRFFTRIPFLTNPGERCSVEENSFVEWSCLLGIPEAWQRSFSKGNLENRGILIIFSFAKWNLIFPPTQIDQLILISKRFSWKLSNNNLLFLGEVSCVELRPVLAQVRGREGGPGDLQGSLHHADIQAAKQPEVDALFARWVQHSAFLSITTLQTYNQHKIYLIFRMSPPHTNVQISFSF